MLREIRKVFMSKGDKDNWPTLHDAESKSVINCWRQGCVNDDGENAQCHKGCAAFSWSGGGPGDFVQCLALPRGGEGHATVMGELVEAPEEDSNAD